MDKIIRFMDVINARGVRKRVLITYAAIGTVDIRKLTSKILINKF